MFTEIFAIMMALAAPKSDPVSEARKVYSNCLVDVTIESLDKKEDQAAYSAKTGTACPAEKEKFRAAVIAGEKEFGSKQSDAEAMADEEVGILMEKYTSSYGDYAKDNSRPTKQKLNSK